MLIILDRDGVINEDSDNYIRGPDDWHPIEGSIAAIADLSKAGHRIAIATNQSGLSRGYFTLDDITEHGSIGVLCNNARCELRLRRCNGLAQIQVDAILNHNSKHGQRGPAQCKRVF